MISGALYISKIKELYLQECGITAIGARELATGLSVSKILILNVWDNPITLEGARLLLQSVVNNKECEQLYINDEHETDYEVHKMMKILQTRREVSTNVYFNMHVKLQ